MAIVSTLQILSQGQTLTAAQTQELFDEILSGRCDQAQIAAAIAMMSVRGVGYEELVGAARAMRSHAKLVPTGHLPGAVIDTCGTGGTPKTFNISTIAAIVVAAAAPSRVHVAKHGNRSRSGRGSAELLAALGVNVDASVEVQARCLREAGVCFCFAIHHHPAARHAAAARQSLGFPTIFNLLGPLTNPADAPFRLTGVFGPAFVEPMARALAELGATRAMVVHGDDGLDEISTAGPTLIAEVEGGRVRLERVDAAEWGVARASLQDLTARSLDEAVRMARGVLGGDAGPLRDIVLVNAGAALRIAGESPTVRDGMELAARAVDSGAAMATLEALVQVSK